MNPSYLARMSAAELDKYASVVGVTLDGITSKEAKIEAIQERREHCAHVSTLGITFTIPLKRVHDKRVSDLLGKVGRTDEETEEAMRLLLGDEQMAELISACTDEDGIFDVDAMALAFIAIITSDQLKNF